MSVESKTTLDPTDIHCMAKQKNRDIFSKYPFLSSTHFWKNYPIKLNINLL